MNIKKRIMSTLVAATLAMSSLPTVLAADGDVEIGFKVGDSTLMINGQAQTVETPYVVGDGVTLVPLRVITEAFGAEVIWDGETKSITLKYPDVEILLQIGNSTAEVNRTAQTLLAAPELTANGVTMVPLRFISETFGAAVSYDESTGGIKVVKQKTTQSNETVGVIDTTYIGDDYYGWSMENFKDAVNTERDFDGTNTMFRKDDSTAISIHIYQREDDFDFDKEYQAMKSTASKYTLTKADKDVNAQKAIVQAKSNDGFADLRLYATDKYVFQVIGTSDTAEMSKKVSSIMDTFQTSYRKSDIHNLSEVEGSMRKYESEMFKYSVKVPSDFFKDPTSSDNNMGFLSNNNGDYSRMAVRVSSKKDGETLQSVVEASYKYDTSNLNPKLADFGQIEKLSYGNNSFLGYKHKIEGAYMGNETSIDVFMEKGDYIYEIVISLSSSRGDKDTVIPTILSTFDAQTLDFAETGTIIYDMADDEGTYTESCDSFKVTVPMTYSSVSVGNDAVALTSKKNDAVVAVGSITRREVATTNPENFLKSSQTSGSKVVQQATSQKIGSKTFYVMTEYIEDKSAKYASYRKAYVYRSNETLIFIDAVIGELYYTDAAIAELDAIAESVVIGK